MMNKNEQALECQGASVLEFVSIGIAAHALCLIYYAGILKILDEQDEFEEFRAHEFPNVHLVRAALATLRDAKVVEVKNKVYSLTGLGKNLAKNIGLLTVPLMGYRKLFAKQDLLLKHPQELSISDIDFATIALTSNDFSAHAIDPLLMDIVKNIKPKGTFCDLGCGTGEKLKKICKALNLSGLGIEQDAQAFKQESVAHSNSPQIEIIQGDITDLKEVWEDVDVVMMCFVCHDFASAPFCIEKLNSLLYHFPHLQSLIILDIVSPSESMTSILPGFDYVHGLQGMTPRNYEETIDLFGNTRFHISEEFPVSELPNTYIWVLKPNQKQ